MVAPQPTRVRVGEHTLQVSSLDKVLYPETGTTKGDVLRYYVEVAPAMVPQLAWRPVTRKRWVDGVGTAAHPGQAFFRKGIEEGAPPWVPTGRIRHKERDLVYPLANSAVVLAWFAQLAALELHVPQWRFGADGEPRNPDRLVIDLDPGPGAGLPECAAVARAVREILEGMGLRPVPVTSGSKGIHLYAPLDGRTTSAQASEVAAQLARELEAEMPDLVVAKQSKALREGRVLVDWSQNNAAKTTVCPYSLRGRTRPTVAAPRIWEELDDPGLAQLTYQEVLERLADGIDPIAAQGWTLDHAPDDADPLTSYRGRRDADRTPEPIPAAVAEPPDGEPTFVIQEHHARRLHWDFRLERDGVLASWAVPKGVPTVSGENRLAVQVEDHPLAYGSFEGVIPKGEYGGGTVRIWDSGTARVEKWRDDEVIVVLHGRPDGGLGGVPRRFALARTGGQGERSHWLLILTKDQPGAAEVPLPADLPSPMLATPGTPLALDDGHEWAFEMKWDGMRAVCAVAGGRVRLVTRNGRDITGQYPELSALVDAVPVDAAVLDGEIVALDEHGRPSFSLLQTRINAPADRVARLARTTPVTLMLFDVLALTVEGRERGLLHTPYRSRRELLEAAVVPSDRIRVPPSFDGDLAAARASSRELGLEGVVAKRADSVYVPGRRSANWLKFKDRTHQAVVVVGWRSDADGRLRSLLVAVPDKDGRLRNVGRVGSGLPATGLTEMASRLRSIERKTPPVADAPAGRPGEVHWVTPKLVGEVTYADVTPSGLLRQPAWRGWRPDLDPADVAWET